MDTAAPKNRADVHRSVTEKIIEAIETGAPAYRMPWHRIGSIGRPVNAYSDRPYHGINVLALWAQAVTSGFNAPHWATYCQWQGLGAQVRRGEKGSLVAFYKPLEEPVGEGEQPKRPRFIARASWVFNAEQVDGWSPPANTVRGEAELLDHLEAFVAATAADIRHGADTACYDPMRDRIDMPDRSSFVGTATSSPTESYYATLFHELIHWTGAGPRLDRNLWGRFGDDTYAMEELIAELGAAFLCADLGCTNEPRPDHAGYLAFWLERLRRDPKALFVVLGQANAAADYLGGNGASLWQLCCQKNETSATR